MKNIVTVGGGTGSYTVLSGLKNLNNVSLTAVVSMADDGGSTGILRNKWKVMPPGDVRQCLAALSGKDFLNKKSRLLASHKIGNVILAILEKITGDFSRGLKIISYILNTKGTIVPVTLDDAVLEISFIDGSSITGEGNIDKKYFQSEVKNLSYKYKTALNPKAREAIIKTDYLIIAPGNLFCSILPNLIVNGFSESVEQSQAKVILIMNLTNKQGHTINWSKIKYLEIIEKYLGKKVDYIVDNNEPFTSEQIEQYRKDVGDGVFMIDKLNDTRVIEAPILSNTLLVQEDGDTVKRSLIRHDPKKLADVIEKIIN